MFELVTRPEVAPDEPEVVTVEFERGVPVAFNGARLGLVALLERAASAGARHGVGIVDQLEDRIVGLKVRDIYEVPAAAIVLSAHLELERLVGTIHQNQLKPQLDQKWAYLVYAGLWWEPLRTDLDAYMDAANELVTGTIGLKLYKGSARAITPLLATRASMTRSWRRSRSPVACSRRHPLPASSSCGRCSRGWRGACARASQGSISSEWVTRSLDSWSGRAASGTCVGACRALAGSWRSVVWRRSWLPARWSWRSAAQPLSRPDDSVRAAARMLRDATAPAWCVVLVASGGPASLWAAICSASRDPMMSRPCARRGKVRPRRPSRQRCALSCTSAQAPRRGCAVDLPRPAPSSRRGLAAQSRLEAAQGELREAIGELRGLVEHEAARRAALEAELVAVREQLAATVVARDGATSEAEGLRAELERLGAELAAARGEAQRHTGGLAEAQAMLAEAQELTSRLRVAGADHQPAHRNGGRE